MLVLVATFSLTSCGDDDDDKKSADQLTKESMLMGKWECTSCDVIDISGVGMGLPDMVKQLISSQIENEMIGEVTEIPDFSTGKVKLEDDVLIMPGSGIRYTILQLSESSMTVRYNTSSSYGGYGLDMTIEAEFEKID